MSHKEETHIFQVHIPFPFDAFFSHKSFLTYLCSHQCLSHINSLTYFYLLPMTKNTLFLWFCYLMLTVYTGWGFTVSKTAIIFFLYLYRPHRNLVFSSVVTPPWWKSYLNSCHYSFIFESSKKQWQNQIAQSILRNACGCNTHHMKIFINVFINLTEKWRKKLF